MKRPAVSLYVSLLTVLILVPLSLIGYKLWVLKYPLDALVPAQSYNIDVSLQVDGHGEDIFVSTYLPRSDSRQVIGDEQNSSGGFVHTVEDDGTNRTVTWKASNVEGRHPLVYSYSVQSSAVRYEIPEDMPVPGSQPPQFADFLKAEAGIQVNDPLIEKKLSELLSAEKPPLRESLNRIHRFLQDKLVNRDFSGYTDALTALKLGEASCNGKSRLFAAFARKMGLPARLAGGLIMKQGTKKVTHQWVEIYINGFWVPFDTINDHFAELPANFVTLYYGDLVLFKHTPNINFQYFFKITKRLVTRSESLSAVQNSPLNFMNGYAVFQKVGISQNLLKIILMMPVGALIMTVLRNVVGLETFGTFLPVLIAAASRETGYWWGMVGFLSIILIAAAIRKFLDRLQLLHTPQMSILLTVVVILLINMTVLGVKMGLTELAHMTLFPIAIIAITSERFIMVQMEYGIIRALRLLAVTIIAVGLCYAVMDLLFLQTLILVFPETMLVLIAFNLWMGRWTGFRLMEFVRFRNILKEGAQ